MRVCVVCVYVFISSLFYTKGSIQYVLFGTLLFYSTVCLTGFWNSVIEHFVFSFLSGCIIFLYGHTIIYLITSLWINIFHISKYYYTE